MGRILEPPPKARGNGARCAEHQPQRHGEATRFGDHSATLGIRTCCGWSFGHSRGPVVVPRCAPCGMVVIEDIDFGGYFCHPPCADFDAYVRLYRTAAARQGADADIGPKLYGMLLDAGW